MTDFVKSVEWFDLVMNTVDTLISSPVSKNQDLTQCVPFTSYSVESASPKYINNMVDVFFDTIARTVNVRRHLAGSSLQLSIYVVEFISAEVKVKQLAFDISAATYSTNLVESVNTDKAGLVMCYAVTTDNCNWYKVGAIAYFSNSNTIYHSKLVPDRVYGHYYIFEDLNDNFRVSHNRYTVGSETQYELITPVDLKNSFILSYSSHDYDSSYASRNFNTSNLSALGKGFIGFNTYATVGTSYFAISIITFLDSTKIRCLNRDLRGYRITQSDITVVDVAEQGMFDLDYSMVIGSSCIQPNAVNSNSTIHYYGYTKYKLIDNRTVNIRHYADNSIDIRYSIQVVNWKGFQVVPDEVVLPVQDSCVKSIEYFRIITSGNKNYSIYKLTKGQVVANCVPFATIISNSDLAGAKFPDINLTDPANIEIYNFATVSMEVSLYVVEFKPEHVRVQKIETTTSQSGISKTIQSVDLTKSFITTYFTRCSSSTNSADVSTRTLFTSLSTISLNCYYATLLQATSYVVESLDDSFSVTTLNNYIGMSSHVCNELYKSFIVSSHYYDYSSTYASRNSLGILRRGSCNIEFFDYTTVGTKFITTYIVKFGNQFGVNKIYTQSLYMYLNSSQTVTKSVNHWNSNSSMLVGTVHGGGTAVNTNSTYTKYLSAVCSTVENSNLVEMKVVSAPSVDIVTEVQVIDWVGSSFEPISKNKIFFGDNTLIISVESFYGDKDIVGQTIRTHELTKGQIGANCITFITFNASTDNIIQTSVDCWVENSMLFVEQSNREGMYLNYHVQVVELNPNKVRIQKGVFYGNNSVSVTVNISSVDITKSFLNFYVTTPSSSNIASYVFLRGTILNSTTLEFKGYNGYTYSGHYEVVESLDDSFTVFTKQVAVSSGSVSVPELRLIDDTVLILYSMYSDYATAGAYRISCRVSKNFSNSLQIDRYAVAGSFYFNFYLIKFKGSLGIKVCSYNLVGSTNSITTNLLLENSGTIIIPQYLNYSDVNSSGAIPYYGMFKHVINNMQLSSILSPGLTGTESRSIVQVIVFLETSNYYFEGSTEVEYKPVSRKVRLYNRNTGLLVDSVTSDTITGEFGFNTTCSGSHYAVALDDELLDNYNDLIYSNILPGEINDL